MSIELIVRPQPAISWETFLVESDPFSIALDGYVEGEPQFDSGSEHLEPRANFNHHENVDRLATRATCGQVLMALRQGLFRCFRNTEGPQATVYVNDCDEDVCLSWFLLKHHHWCEQIMNPLLNRLVAMEDALDATAGAYPYPTDMPTLRELAWVFEPYRQFRLGGGLDKKDSSAYRSIIEDVGGRISAHLMGNGEEIPLDTRYEKIGGGSGWSMVKEIGAQARTGMFSDGITAFVSVREIKSDRWAYVVGRLSPFIPANLPDLIQRLNFEEGHPEDAWGGSNIIMGSPRNSGSTINPDRMAKIVSEYVR